MTTRISARLDSASAQKLERLIEQTRSSMTDILKKAIDSLYQRECRQHTKAAEILAATGFIASGEDADPDLSESYKSELSTLLHNKHGQR